jgi:hypothetical protein
MRRTLAENNSHYDHSPVLGPGLLAGEAKSCCWGSHASKCDGMRLTVTCEPHGSRPLVASNLPPRPPGKALGPQYETCRNPVKRKQPSISGIRPSKKFCKFMRGLPIASCLGSNLPGHTPFLAGKRLVSRGCLFLPQSAFRIFQALRIADSGVRICPLTRKRKEFRISDLFAIDPGNTNDAYRAQ